jgi:hypothetical protein
MLLQITHNGILACPTVQKLESLFGSTTDVYDFAVLAIPFYDNY